MYLLTWTFQNQHHHEILNHGFGGGILHEILSKLLLLSFNFSDDQKMYSPTFSLGNFQLDVSVCSSKDKDLV